MEAIRKAEEQKRSKRATHNWKKLVTKAISHIKAKIRLQLRALHANRVASSTFFFSS